MQIGQLTESAVIEPKAASFIHKIKKSTADLHLRLESQALLRSIMTPVVTHLQYYYYLTLMKKVQELYERSVVTRVAGTFPGFEQRKASQLISDDLSKIAVIASKGMVKDYSIPDEKISLPFALGFM